MHAGKEKNHQRGRDCIEDNRWDEGEDPGGVRPPRAEPSIRPFPPCPFGPAAAELARRDK